MSLPELIPSNLPVFTRKYPRSHFANSVIPKGAALLFAQSDSHSGVRLITKNSDGTYKEVGGGADITLGVVDSNGKFQPLKFDGTDASESGEPETVVNYKSWNSTYPPPGPVPTPSMNFYKCASVDTSNSTWTGHLASISDSTGIWYFSSDSTSLVYDRLKPVVGSVYDEECSFRAIQYKKNNMPSTDLIFYAPLSSYTAIDEYDNPLTYTGNYQFEVLQGVPSVYLNGGTSNDTATYIDTTVLNGPTGSQAFTLSFWYKIRNQRTNHEYWTIFYYGGISDNRYGINLLEKQGTIYFVNAQVVNDQQWHHYCLYGSSDNCTLIVDGNNSFSQQTYGINSTVLRLGASIRDSSSRPVYAINGNMAAFRIYNRALTSDEIAALANEFHPIAS